MLALEHDGSVRSFEVDPVALGFAPATHEQLIGGDPADNAEVVRRGSPVSGDRIEDIVVLNAAALVVADAAGSLADGVEAASVAIDGGKAAATLDVWIEASRAQQGRRPHAPGLERKPGSGIRRPRRCSRPPRRDRTRRRVDR